MTRRAYTYVSIVYLAAIIVLLVQPWSAIARTESAALIGVLAFVALSVFAEALAIDFSVGPNRVAHSSIAFLPVFACAILYPPAVATVAATLAALISQLALRRRIAWVAGFNISVAVLSVAAATNLAALINEPTIGRFDIDFLAFGTLALALFISNVLLVGGLISIRERIRYRHVIHQLIGPRGGNIFYGILASPIAVLAAYLYDKLYVGGLILVVLPLLLIRYSYLSKVQLQQANQDLLRVLIKAIETRDPYTSGHSVRVSLMARAIAEDLGLSRKATEQIETAGLLHDIGKIDMVYATIIQKPHRLTDEESLLIKTHAVKGAELLQNLTSLPQEVVRGVRHHHERYDGNGYPDGLAGEAIPLAARIIMLCDSIDAMLSDRPYRRALSIEQVRAELIRCSGTQFDPAIVAAILRGNTLDRARELIARDGAAAVREPQPV